MARFNIYFVATNHYHQLFQELINSLQQSLIDLGHVCTVLKNEYASDAINILLGSTVFAVRDHDLLHKLAGKPYIVYQMEQLGLQAGHASNFEEYLELLKNADAILEYSFANRAFLESLGVAHKTHYLPPGFHRILEKFRPRQEQDIDVLLYGSQSARRDAIMEKLAETRRVEYVGGIYGVQLDHLIARAKIVMNIHYWDELKVLETVRISYLLANHSFVVSEDGDHNPYGEGVVYAPYEQLVETTLRNLQLGARARDQIAQKGYLAIRDIDMVSHLRDILEKLPLNKLQASSGENMAVAGYFDQPRPEIVELIPKDAKTILEIGCASGVMGELIKKRQNCVITGIDMNPVAVQKAVKRLDHVICGDAFQVLPALPDQAYDLVIMADMLEHVVDTQRLLELVATKLSKAGKLIISVPNVRHWSILRDLLQGDWTYVETGILDNTHLRFFTPRSLEIILRNSGFKIEERCGTTKENMTPPKGLGATLKQFGIDCFDELEQTVYYQIIVVCSKV